MTVENELHLQLYAIAPAPCRDYYGLTVTSSQIILNIWNISHGPHIYPKCYKSLLEDFQEEKFIQNEICRNFGNHVLNFCRHLANKDHNLQYLPTKLFLRILRHLAAQDILSLSQTSKIFFELCNTDTVWKIIFRKKLRRPIIREDCKAADDIGWKKMLMNKLTIRTDIKKRISKATTLENKHKNNSSKSTICKQNNIDIIQNVKRSNLSKIANDAIYIKELSAKDGRKKYSNGKNVTFKNDKPVSNSTPSNHVIRNPRNVKTNLTVSGKPIRNRTYNSTTVENLREKTGIRIISKNNKL